MRRGKDLIKGIIIGATMTVPGASGGTMAMLLGIYEDILAAAADLFKDTRRSLAMLLPVLVGGALGAALMAGRVERLLLFRPLEAGSFFAGLVTGGVPCLLWQAAREKKPALHALWLLPGALVGMLLPLCPALFRADGAAPSFLLLLLVGLLLAAALVLPGISASSFLYICGMYDRVLAALRDRELGLLLPLALGALAGTFLTARLFRRLLRRFPAGCHYIIAGFLLASATEALGTLPAGGQWPRMALFGALGLTITLLFSAREAGWRPFRKRGDTPHDHHTHRALLRRGGAGDRPPHRMAGDLPRHHQ